MYQAYIYEHATYFNLKGVGYSNGKIPPRGKIRGFSHASRRRILATVHTIDQSRITSNPRFITLTYPATYSGDFVVWKRHLDVFLKRLRRKIPSSFTLWKLEFQSRGAPHFHLINISTLPLPDNFDLKAFRLWVSRIWYLIVNSNDIKHLHAGTNVQFIDSWPTVTRYVSKYIAKTQANSLTSYTGRFWGISNRKYMPISEITVDLEPKEFHALRRVARIFIEKKLRHKIHLYKASCGLSIYLDYDTSLKLLHCICPRDGT